MLIRKKNNIPFFFFIFPFLFGHRGEDTPIPDFIYFNFCWESVLNIKKKQTNLTAIFNDNVLFECVCASNMVKII